MFSFPCSHTLLRALVFINHTFIVYENPASIFEKIVQESNGSLGKGTLLRFCKVDIIKGHNILTL